MNRSRIAERAEKQSRNTIILTTVGSILIVLLLIIFGIPALMKFSLLLQNTHTQPDTNFTTSDNFVAAPNLDPLPNATSSAVTSVSGIAVKGETVQLYLNNASVDETTVNQDNTFRFPHVTLHEGDNTIAAKALTPDNKESNLSQSYTITYSNKPPTLTIDAPADNQTFSSDQNVIEVRGETDPNVQVTVNGAWAQIEDGTNYSYDLRLQPGDNQIKVEAVDQAGNKTDKQIKVTYNQ